MEKTVNFSRKPFRGIFKVAADRLKIKGVNARNVAANRYQRGNRMAVMVVDAIIRERIAEQAAHRETLQQAAQIQREAI